MITSFVIFLMVFAAIGVASVVRSKNTPSDYYLAGGELKPWLVGLSAVATNNSGYMFIGVIGYTYVTGLASIWLMVGWILGDLMGSLLIHRRFISMVKSSKQITFASVLSVWFGDGQRKIRVLIALISVIFLLAYTAAQLVAGSKALHVLFGWPEQTGAILGAVIVTVYCLAGGIRASIWTDAAQSFVMIVAMGILLYISVSSLGGVSEAVAQFNTVPGYLSWTPSDLAFGGIAGWLLFFISWIFAGVSTIAQPHIMVRFMALNDVKNLVPARVWYYTWFTLFYCMATGVGLLARLHLPDTQNFDAELALPTMAMALLPEVLVGVILAGIFAATMSTADSLVMSCSASISQDLFVNKVEGSKALKVVTIGSALLALSWALSSQGSVFNLVIFAWSGLASAFAPLMVAIVFGYRPSLNRALIAVVLGLGVAVGWRLLGWNAWLYEGLPGVLVGSIVLFWGTKKA